MSAPRRTATRGQAPGAGSPPPVPPAAPAARPAAAPSRPPRPEAPKPVAEPTGKFGKTLDGLKQSYQDTVAELKKVNWPDRETTKNLTLLVIAISAVMGLLLGGIDFILQGLFQAIG